MNKFYWILNFILIFDTGRTVGRSISSNLQYLTREFNCSWIKDAESETNFLTAILLFRSVFGSMTLQ